MADGVTFLFGRRIYEHLATVWPDLPDEDLFANVLDKGRGTWRRGCSRSLPWRNSTLLRREADDTVSASNPLTLSSGRRLFPTTGRHPGSLTPGRPEPAW